MFTYLQHMFNFLHLQENLLYVQGQKPIAQILFIISCQLIVSLSEALIH